MTSNEGVHPLVPRTSALPLPVPRVTVGYSRTLNVEQRNLREHPHISSQLHVRMYVTVRTSTPKYKTIPELN